jgi:hypothetical protein
LTEAVERSLEFPINENCMWVFARAIIGAFGKRIYNVTELESFAAHWWRTAGERRMLPDGAILEEYVEDFISCVRKVKQPLDTNSLDNAKKAAEQDIRENEVVRFGERTAKLIALCRQLQSLTGDAAFFLSQRDANEYLNARNPYVAKNAFARLIEHGILKEEQKGTITGKKASRYRYLGNVSKPPQE